MAEYVPRGRTDNQSRCCESGMQGERHREERKLPTLESSGWPSWEWAVAHSHGAIVPRPPIREWVAEPSLVRRAHPPDLSLP
jgi:hypothetical protein